MTQQQRCPHATGNKCGIESSPKPPNTSHTSENIMHKNEKDVDTRIEKLETRIHVLEMQVIQLKKELTCDRH